MNEAAFIALVHNAALLLALVLVFDLATFRYPLANRSLRQLGVGVVLGIMGVGIMLAPFQLVPGIVFDTRSVLLAVSGLYFGLVPTLIAVLCTAAYRLSQGGAAAWTGVYVIVASAAIGLAWRRRRREALADLGWRELYGLGLIVHVVMLALMFTVGWSAGLAVVAAIGLPVIVIYPVATAALALLLGSHLQRLRAETELRDTTAVLRVAGQLGHFGGWRVNLATNRVFWSDEVAAIHEMPAGYSPSLEEGISFYAPEDRDKISEVFGRCAREGVPYDAEMQIITARGARRAVRAIGEAIRDDQGKITGVRGAFQDITLHKQAEAELQASQLLYRSFVEQLPAAVFRKDRAGRYVMVNPTFCRLKGVKAEEFVGRTATEVAAIQIARQGPGGQATKYANQGEEVQELILRDGRVVESEEEYTNAEGRTSFLHVVRMPVFGPDGAVIGVQGIQFDVTARKQAEAEVARQNRELQETVRQLGQSQAMLQLIIESIPVRVFWKGRDLRYQGCNRLFARDAGLERPEELLGRDDCTLVWREQADRYQADDREVMDSGQSKLNIIEPQTTAAGNTIWLQTSKVPLRASDGQVVGLLGVYEDITLRRQSEQAIAAAQAQSTRLLAEAERSRQALLSLVEDQRDTEARLKIEQELAQSTLDAQQVHICVLNQRGTIIAVNRAWREFGAANGATAAVIHGVGADYLAVCRQVTGAGAETAATFTERLEAILAGRADTLELEYPCDSPEQQRWFVARAQRFPGREEMRVVVLHENITARKLAEEQLRQSEDRWRHAVSGSAAGIWDANLATGESFYSDRSLEILGYAPGDIAQQMPVWTALIHPDDAAIGREAMAAHLAGQKPFYEAEHRFRCKDGTYKWISSRGRAVFDDAGKLVRVTGTHVDIHERKLAEEALRASLREQEALLKEVHHRVKNNLQVITSLLRLEAGRIREPGTQEVLRDMQGRIRTMALLHEALYRSGNFAAVDMGGYIRQLATQVFRAYNTLPGRVQLVLDLIPAQVDMDQAIPCGLIVNELVTNSLKHAFPGSAPGEVRIKLEQAADKRLVLKVSDTGPGLPEGFDPAKSSSLGLRLVSDLTRQLQGRLEVGTGPGAGFVLHFSPRQGMNSRSPFVAGPKGPDSASPT